VTEARPQFGEKGKA